MRRFILIGIMVLSAISGFAQDATRVQTLKEQQKVLNLTSKLNKLQLDYEKAKADYDAIISKVADANAEANMVTTDFNTSDASGTVKDAKDAIKKLEATKAANKKLAKMQKKLSKMQKKIAKLQSRIDDMNKKIKFVNQ